MNAHLSWAAALFGLALATAPLAADPYYPPPMRTAPDACGPGFYCVGPNGMVYGPSYWVRPPWEPFNGAPPPMAQRGAPVYPGHPYVRSPRDFFMWRENMEDQMRRDVRPALIP